MRLATRLSAFFLAALAIVLAGFSAALYVSARVYLHRQVDDRLAAGLAVLAAAAEVQPDGVEWEPHERVLSVGDVAGRDPLCWAVHTEDGRLVDRSPGPGEAALTPESDGLAVTRRQEGAGGGRWRVAGRRLLPAARGQDATGQSGPSGTLHGSLVVTVAVPIGPVERTLGMLGSLLIGLSAGVWLIAACLGRWLADRALAPLGRMVEAARGLDASEAGWSIPPAGTNDELEDMGRAFNDLLGRLRVAFERQRRFSADASHQLRTPLTALIGQIEVALRRDRERDEYRRVLGLVRGQAGNLARIVEALLFLGRADSEAGLPESVAIDLPAWLAGHLAGHEHAASIVLDPGPGAPRGEGLVVRAHPALLGQLVDNLLDNAAKYGPAGGPIAVRLGSEPGAATIAVEDSGPGIDPEDIPRVFEPFFRSARARGLGRPGVGLGLAVVQRIASAFGGAVAVESPPGMGCRFVVRLPRLADGARGPTDPPDSPARDTDRAGAGAGSGPVVADTLMSRGPSTLSPSVDPRPGLETTSERAFP